MLGEAAMTAEDAKRYFAAYEAAIRAIGAAAATQAAEATKRGRAWNGVIDGPGMDQALGAAPALRARASRARDGRAGPRLVQSGMLARRHDIGLNIDAEESERLDLSLDLLERLCHEDALAGWSGIGFVIQAYQKRCPAVVDFLVDLGAAGAA
ncbi:MAG: proline dehydrogenase family protein [Rubrivivax sp.]